MKRQVEAKKLIGSNELGYTAFESGGAQIPLVNRSNNGNRRQQRVNAKKRGCELHCERRGKVIRTAGRRQQRPLQNVDKTVWLC